jgi:hypothetical protein
MLPTPASMASWSLLTKFRWVASDLEPEPSLARARDTFRIDSFTLVRAVAALPVVVMSCAAVTVTLAPPRART